MAVEIPRSIDDLPVKQPRWVGQPMKRVEAPLLLTGRAPFTDNLKFPGMLHAAYLRSPHAHARILQVDTSKAERLPGVVAILTGEDMRSEVIKPRGIPPGFTSYPLAVEKVRFSGEPIAVVAAISRYVAEDALELIDVEYETLPPVVDARRAMAADSPLLYLERGTNVAFMRTFTYGQVDEACAKAEVVVKDQFRFPRVSANPIETNACIASWDPLTNELTAWGNFQTPLLRLPGVSAMLGLPTNKIRLMPQPQGGSFGSKTRFVGDLVTMSILSKRVGGRPVKWIEDRLEHLRAAGSDAWERYYEGELALTNEGKITSFRVKCVDDMGAAVEFAGPSLKPLSQFTGCYEIPTCQYDIAIVVTNKNPQGAYRGYGPPPQQLLLERLMDKAAAHFHLDPAEIRRRNFIPPERFPYTLPTGNRYDSGNYAGCLDAVLKLANYAERRQVQAGARKEGRSVGLGLVSSVEVGVPNPHWAFVTLYTGRPMPPASPEGAVVRVDAFGKIVAEVGFAWAGQGQHTFVTQLLADYFGVEPGDVTVRTVDSQASPHGIGPIGSREAVSLAGAVLGAAGRVRDKLIRMAAVLLESNPADVELQDGKLSVRGAPQRGLPVAQVAGALLSRSELLPPELDGSAEASYVWNPEPPLVDGTMPPEASRAQACLTAANAVHLVQVEVDPDTGMVTIQGYWLADDCGTRINPALVEGQTQGGLAQGLGAVLLEEYAYGENGERLSSTLMDYLLPTIHDVPQTQKIALTTPSPFSPLGAKGCGEGAIHATPAALYCAVNDALAQLGAEITELPMSPLRVWKSIQQAESGLIDSIASGGRHSAGP